MAAARGLACTRPEGAEPNEPIQPYTAQAPSAIAAACASLIASAYEKPASLNQAATCVENDA